MGIRKGTGLCFSVGKEGMCAERKLDSEKVMIGEGFRKVFQFMTELFATDYSFTDNSPKLVPRSLG